MERSRGYGTTNRRRSGSILAFLIALSSGCAGAPTPEAPDQSLCQRPSTAALFRTAEPKFSGRTNEDLLRYVDQLRAAIASCNADKAAIDEAFTQIGPEKGRPQP